MARGVIIGTPVFGQIHRTLDPPRPWPNKLLARYGGKGIDHSGRPHSSGEAQLRSVRLASLIDRLQYRSRLTRLTSRGGLRNFGEFSGFHVVDITVNSYSSGSLPASNASRVSPNIIVLMVQSLPFILTMNPSYNGLTFEQLLIENATRSDTVFLLSAIR